jgi:hypothetical protein
MPEFRDDASARFVVGFALAIVGIAFWYSLGAEFGAGVAMVAC